MARPTLDDPDFDEFNAWTRWVADHADVESPFCGPDDQDADGRLASES